MPVFDTKTIDHFTPDHYDDAPDAPVFHIRAANRVQRANYHRAVASLGARYPADELLIAELRAGIREGLEADEQPKWLAVVEAWEVARDEAAESDEPPQDLIDPATAENLAVLERDMRRNRPAYAELYADRAHWLEIAPYIAAQHFLVGWEVPTAWQPCEFKTDRNGLVPDAVLERLSETDQAAIGARALALMRPDSSAEKNSGSRPGSPAGRGTSTAARKPSTARPGKSPVKSTGKIPASS